MEAGVSEGLAKLLATVALDVLDQHQDVRREVEEGSGQGGGEGLRHRAVVHVQGDDSGHRKMMPEAGGGRRKAVAVAGRRPEATVTGQGIAGRGGRLRKGRTDTLKWPHLRGV